MAEAACDERLKRAGEATTFSGMRYLSENALNVYTDGSSRMPRVGGLAYVLVWCDSKTGEEHTYTGRTESWPGATQNEMELQALIEVLKRELGQRPIVDPAHYDFIVIHTDSAYVAENFEPAIYEWSRNGWKNRRGRVPENLKQWRELVRLVRRAARNRKHLKIEKIRRRSDEFARAADNEAKRSSKSPLTVKVPLRPRSVTRKLSDRMVEPGCVPMRGQEEVIRIVEVRPLGHPHRGYRYKYEVICGPHAGCVDLADCDELLSRASCYRIRFNEDQYNARILEVMGKFDPEEMQTASTSSGSGE